jgi:hypothetical protein
MATKSSGALAPSDTVRALVEVADVDTVYRDLYLTRARALLSEQLPADQYRGLRDVHRQVDDTIAKSRAAAMLQDWKLVEELAGRAAQLRKSAEAKAAVMALGELVYEAPAVAVDPFSPGLATFAKSAGDPAELRDQTVAKLARLAAADAPSAGLYEARRAFLASLAIASRRPETQKKDGPAKRAVADLERLAYEAAQRGEVGELQRLAAEILKAKETEAAAKPAAVKDDDAPPAPVATADACPVDLGAPFAEDATKAARALGLTAARTEPLPEAAPLLDYVAARAGQLVQSDADSERDGAMKIEALVDQGVWPAGVSEHLKTLVAQYVRHAFVSSGGARYRPAFLAESVLIEDFPEDQDGASPLLDALGLRRRRQLARVEIEAALLERGAAVLRDRLRLDPQEFRLVCIPQDLYTRFGRERGWGVQKQWTHFDGYQVLSGGRLRALVGGDTRYGGLLDLTSIAPTDQRDSVIARFAVVRRARQVARWR